MKQHSIGKRRQHAAVKYGQVMYEPVKHRAVKYKAAEQHGQAKHAALIEEWASDV
jgi:hypothetical protein